MTTKEFSEEFDTLVSSYSAMYSGMSEDLLMFDEYEKSVFLTRAQEDLVKSLYSGDATLNSFEKTEEVRRYLSTLVHQYTTSKKIDTTDVIDKNSTVFKLPTEPELWYIVYEGCHIEDSNTCIDGTTLHVVPTAHDDFYKTNNNPFRGSNERRVLRIDKGGDEVELVSKYNIKDYTIRYVAKPSPIVLTNLDNINVEGISEETDCKLPSSLHGIILTTAVNAAIASRIKTKGK